MHDVKMSKTKNNQESLRINTTIKGIYAKWASEIKNSGLTTSNRDLVNQGIKAFYNNIAEERLKIARLKSLEQLEGVE